ncbi:Tfx family DNA-binding protein [Halohasta salina]|uniref:Tfx family DNA-binding protein n=1 Tax=Halohasta salina TaxID=2961621 RepID=UPI0020A4A58C|nr:Tfx family DNA-binding protein [Halohasta salina]
MSDETDQSASEAEPDVDALLERAGFDPDTSVLTRRQAEVLALREQGMRQRDIAELLGTSRANVSNVEASARENIDRARETIAFADAVAAPVRVEIPAGTDLFDVPTLVFDACDDAGLKVKHTAPELMNVVSDGADDAVEGRAIHERLLVGVTESGAVRVRQSGE